MVEEDRRTGSTNYDPVPMNALVALHKNKKSSFVWVIVFLIVIIIIGVFVYRGRIHDWFRPPPVITPTLTPLELRMRIHPVMQKKPDDHIMQVGDEIIYRRDLTIYIQNIQQLTRTHVENELDRLKRESLVLQMARDEGMIDLVSKIYNAPDKDYAMRTRALEQIREEFQSQLPSISGTMVSVWFLNENPGLVGLERGKQIAYEKITDLHAQVRDGSISIEEAGQRIRNDTSLMQLDTNYEANALYTFEKVPRYQSVTSMANINDIIVGMDSGELSDVFMGRDSDGQGVLYGFVYLEDAQEGMERFTSFNEWVEYHDEAYEIKTLY